MKIPYWKIFKEATSNFLAVCFTKDYHVSLLNVIYIPSDSEYWETSSRETIETLARKRWLWFVAFLGAALMIAVPIQTLVLGLPLFGLPLHESALLSLVSYLVIGVTCINLLHRWLFGCYWYLLGTPTVLGYGYISALMTAAVVFPVFCWTAYIGIGWALEVKKVAAVYSTT